ncbi:MAG: hypothetical protein LUG26_04465 [Ruminococcus sp.]|nr:hypothetical protein [Ruminococcus sp.]
MLKAIGSRKELTNIVYFCYISDIIDSSEVSELKNITHLYLNNTFPALSECFILQLCHMQKNAPERTLSSSCRLAS